MARYLPDRSRCFLNLHPPHTRSLHRSRLGHNRHSDQLQARAPDCGGGEHRAVFRVREVHGKTNCEACGADEAGHSKEEGKEARAGTRVQGHRGEYAVTRV